MNTMSVDEVSKLIADGTHTIINELKLDDQADRTLVISRITRYFLEKAIYDVLFSSSDELMDDEEVYQETHDKFLELKSYLQDDIAEAFENAFMKYTNKNMDYACVISPFPNPANKEMC